MTLFLKFHLDDDIFSFELLRTRGSRHPVEGWVDVLASLLLLVVVFLHLQA